MASGVVELVNQALTSLGVEPINDMDENTRPARFAKQKFDHVRDTVLRMHTWNSATKRASLPRLEGTPVFGYAHQYQLPADFLRLLTINQHVKTRHRIEHNRVLLTDEGAAEITYVARVETIVEMDLLLQEVIAAKLAVELAMPLKGDLALRERMLSDFNEKYAAAVHVNEREKPMEQFFGSEWIEGRTSGPHSTWIDSRR